MILENLSPVDERFWGKVQITWNPDKCWHYHGTRNRGLHGMFTPTHKTAIQAHRYSWQFRNGPIPDGLWVLHTCDVPYCVNPRHLYLGTALENNRDRLNRGRNPNKNKTHCKRGHPYDAENTYYRTSGARVCRACSRLRESRKRQKAGLIPTPFLVPEEETP